MMEHLDSLKVMLTFEAGEKAREHSFNNATEDMRKTLDKIKDALDDAGWIEYNDNW
jgi:hypothetical protein